jgi:TetR/AcrR family transcriptional regulator
MEAKETKSTEEKVIAAAVKEFAALGYAGARVDAIAERAKVNKAMIYYHFKSKEMLYERILKDITENIFKQVKEAAVGEGDPIEVLYSIISRYMKILNSFDREFFQIMLREIASGGKHFRKIAIPSLVLPVFSIIDPLIKEAMVQGRMRELNPYYTFMQIIGGIIFFNVIKIPMEGSAMEKLIFKEGYLDGYRENLFKILKNGLELEEGKL